MAVNIRSSGLAGSLSEKRMYGLGAETPGTLHIGVQGKQGEPGVPGPRGPAGQDGITPHIGENGNWFVGDFDTGLPSRGKDGNNATVEEIEAAIAKYFEENPPSFGDVSLTGYAKEEWVNQNFQPKGNYLTEVPSGYATEQFVTDKITEAQIGGGAADTSGDFYSSLFAAITDINNGTKANIVPSESAKVKVFPADNGRTTVMLLDNVEEGSLIDINKDTDLVLNGKTLSLTEAGAYLNFGSGTDCTINGEVDGGKIIKECTSTSGTTYILNTTADKLIVKGGQYTISGDNFKEMCFRVASPCNTEIYNANISATNTSTISEAYARTIQAGANSRVFIDNSVISGRATTTTIAVYDNTGLGVEICNSNISAVITANNGTANAVASMNNSFLKIKKSKLVSDSVDCHESTTSATSTLYGTVYLQDVDAFGTHSGISVSDGARCYVNGGTYTGYCHGGFYFSHGSTGEVFVNDATIRAGNYEGEFDYSGKVADIYGAFYIGSKSNTTAYLDNCTIDGEGCTQGTFVMRGTDGETNNTINISNSNITTGTIRIDANRGHRLNIGMGCNFTPSDTTTPADAVVTKELYRRNYADKDLNGNDYDALLGVVEISKPVRGTDYWTDADKTEMINAVLAALDIAEEASF